jgi:hypothetical protein
VSGSHANPLAIKTNAPPGVLWDIIRCWIKDGHPVNVKVRDLLVAGVAWPPIPPAPVQLTSTRVKGQVLAPLCPHASLPACLQDTNSYMGRILAKEPTLQASFKRAAGAMKKDDTPRFVLVGLLPFCFFFCFSHPFFLVTALC